MRSRIAPLKKIARYVSAASSSLITSAFKKLISRGDGEGLNNNAKVTIRESYGFRTSRVLELTLYHSLGKLPEPESTHNFF